MTRAGSSPYGIYTYTGDVPYDGEIRYRYLFAYISGTGGGGSDQAVYEPHDRYIVRPMGDLTWSSPRGTPPLPDDRVDDALWRRPRRWVSMLDAFPPNFSGQRSQTADIVLHNNHPIAIGLGNPSIVDRATGTPIVGLTVAPVSGTFPMTVPAGGTATLRATAQATIANAQSVFWEAGLTVPMTLGVNACRFGPIWVDVGFTVNPS